MALLDLFPLVECRAEVGEDGRSVVLPVGLDVAANIMGSAEDHAVTGSLVIQCNSLEAADQLAASINASLG